MPNRVIVRLSRMSDGWGRYDENRLRLDPVSTANRELPESGDASQPT
ncbi:MAG: hypothetical protein JXB23_02295 [Candidatus Aminicenantes bacterium]|nr:hypothetical protein [Candidatus Aminicenantes bacterium]